MDVGATAQEVKEAKTQDLAKAGKRYLKDENKPVYYYQSNGKISKNTPFPQEIYVPIENYADTMINQLDLYLHNIERSLDVDTVDVLVTLRSVIFPNKKEFQIVNPSQPVAVWEMVQRYTKCIMQHVGMLAECVLVDNCANNAEINKICMNIALFKKDILETYDIPYNEYVAYSTSLTYMIYKDPRDGLYKTKKHHDYNPHHTSKDIGWCKRDNIWEQLRTEMSELRYVDNAKLQVKATLDCNNLNLENYLLTPVIVFDFDHGFNKLKERYPHHLVYSANNLFPDMALTMEKYFQIIAAYVSGITNKLNITETDLKNDKRLQTLFNTSAYEITKGTRDLERTGLIKLAEDAGKPVHVMA